VVALVHHPLALETGLSAAQSERLAISERAALASTRSVVATSRWTADLLVERFGVPSGRMVVVEPGTDRRPPSAAGASGPLRLISVGAIVPRKGFDILVEALAPLINLPWHLVIVGDRQRDLAAVARLDGLVARYGLEQRIDCHANVSPERLTGFY